MGRKEKTQGDTMIVDWFYPEYSDDFGSPSLYLRTRDADGDVHTRIIEPEDDDYIRPFCWIAEGEAEWKINRLKNRFPSMDIINNETAVGIDGKRLVKVEVDKPNDLWDIKDDI